MDVKNEVPGLVVNPSEMKGFFIHKNPPCGGSYIKLLDDLHHHPKAELTVLVYSSETTCY